jgi:glycosyltransferase involved in cell wall biosynthesis
VSNASAGLSEPIRVLHLRDSPWVDGPGRTILETAARIDRALVDYCIAPLVTHEGSEHPLLVAARERGVPVQPILDDGQSVSALVARVTSLVDRMQIEILHSSEFRTNVVALLCRSRRPSLRVVSTAHGWIANDARGKLKTLFDRVLLRRFDTVILVSHAMRNRLPRWWVPDERVRVIHNALPTESFGLGVRDMQRRIRGPGEPIILLAVGRLSAEKGFDLLLRAVARLAPDYPQLRLTIAGTGPEEPALRQLGGELGLTDRVRYAGYLQDMPRAYVESDLVVQSSHTEGLPNVMLEAAFLGAPVVATDVGGTREVIEHGVDGWLVAPGSVGALETGIRHYLEEPSTFVAMAATARRRVEDNFSIDARTAKQMALYQTLAGRVA